MAVEFNEPEFPVAKPKIKARSSFSDLVIKMGLAKDEKGAQDILLIAAVLIFLLAGIVFWFALA